MHAYPERNGSCGFFCFMKGQKRSRKDFRFVASSKEEAIQWVGGFADQQCYVNCLPHPLVSSKKQASSELLPIDPPPELIFRCKNPPRMLVILNPRSGRGKSSKVFYRMAEPIFKVCHRFPSLLYNASCLSMLFSSVGCSCSCSDQLRCTKEENIELHLTEYLLCHKAI